MVLGAGCPGRQAACGVTGAGRRSTAGRKCVGKANGEGERLADRGPRSAAGDGHKISKKKVNVLRHALVRLPLSRPFSTPLGLLLGSFPGPIPIPCLYHKVWPAGPGREIRGMKEGYLRLAPIPTFLAGMIMDPGQGRAAKGLRSGGYIFYLSALLLFRVPSPAILLPSVLAQYSGKIWGWYPGANGSPSGSP
jgi:hypothetical protein